MEEEVKFYSDPKRYLTFWLVAGTGGSLILFLDKVRLGAKFDLLFDLLLFAFVVLYTCLWYWVWRTITLFILRRYYTSVSALGITRHRLFSVGSHFAWESIAEVVPGVESIGLMTEGQQEQVVVPALTNQQSFYDAVCAHAPADNPLRVWIEALPERKGKVG